MKSLEFATDALVMTGVSVLEHHPDRIVQRTPSEPDFWFGNRVLFLKPPSNAEVALAQFHADLPEARHICISWDVPGLDPAPVSALFAGTGLEVEVGDTLTLSGPLQRVPVPEGIELRAFGPEDWAKSDEIAIAIARDEGRDYEGYAAYLARRAATRRDQIAAGLGQWFGAFDNDLLVGDMGIFFNESLIRYQHVQTRASHRGRGICSSLLVHALDWAGARAPEATPVIVADSGSAAGRLYRRAGFTQAETAVSAVRPPA